MIYCNVEKNSLPKAYHDALLKLGAYGVEIPCPDYNTKIIDCCMSIRVINPLAEPMISKCGIFDTESLQQYKMEIEDGILDFMIGATENAWEYTYHDRIAHQLPFVKRELQRNPYSRRAVIDVRENITDMYNEHPACLQSLQFTVRDNKLNMLAYMRSNDAVNAAFMNMFAFIMLQKKVADELGYEVGEYIHRANSFHVYEKDYELFGGYLRSINTRDDLTYPYYSLDGWKPLMEKEIPKIVAKVEAQKEKYNIKEN